MASRVKKGETANRGTKPRRKKGRVQERNAVNGEKGDLEVLEFIQAVDRYKRKTQKAFPTWSEILGILKSLGYRKV